ncbi:Hybrid signal transduction histidine kinase K [Elsinoe australis]|uniref:histidine kinase n=1 Tax=Elsinoe australis TaxID=40998 RepID=A0A2P7YF01_9PEZI|nr:Hybrid signal transduction histidine kinase K [Elsinoe australis]
MERSSDPVNNFQDHALASFFSSDPRPTFIVRPTRSSLSEYQPFDLIYYNNALKIHHDYLQELLTSTRSSGRSRHDAHTASFISFVNKSRQGDFYHYRGILWLATQVQQEWSIFTGTVSHMRHNGEPIVPTVQSPPRQDVAHQSNNNESHPSTSGSSTKGRDIDVPMTGSSSKLALRSSPFVDWFESVDWSGTLVGPIDSWPLELRQAVTLSLSNPDPGAVYWGPERVIIYNEPFTTLIKDLHPFAMGTSAKISFGAFWSMFEDICRQVETGGQAVKHNNGAVQLDRSGFLEEAYFNYTYMPIRDGSGRICGMFHQAVETTSAVVSERQLSALLRLGEMTAQKADLGEFWQATLRSLEDNTVCIPFAAIYLAERYYSAENDLSESFDGVANTGSIYRLEGTSGSHEGLASLPSHIDLSTDAGMGAAFKAAWTQPLLTPIKARTVFEPLLAETDHGHVVVCPLKLSYDKHATCLIIGLDPLRPYDRGYREFLDLIVRQIEDGATSVVLLEQERRRMKQTVESIEQEKQRLSKALEHQMREAKESEFRFLQFAKQAPVGVYIISSDGEVVFHNEAYLKLMALSPGGRLSRHCWRDNIHPDDITNVDMQWQALINGKPRADFELRVLRHNAKPDDPDGITYLSTTCFTQLDTGGHTKSVTGISMDISVHRAHERVVAERLANALEAKRAQENFMDMVSHEMRNPLNAILQCAEEVSQLMEPYGTESQESMPPARTIASLDAVGTILYCGYHQKQIIDDVLTISKLDSQLLSLAPSPTRPIQIAERAVNMYASEIRSSNMTVFVKQAEGQNEEQCIMIDPGRVLQILINLVGNAVKFLKARPTRELGVTVSLSHERPLEGPVKFVSSGRQVAALNPSEEWGSGEIVYVHFTITDTGPGLTQEETNSLFGRFKQANPKTYAQYGGSGLGLFISRELAELHGGEIGLVSELGTGSTFSFYVRGRADKTQTVHASNDGAAASSPKMMKRRTSSSGFKRNEMISPRNSPSDDKKSAKRATVLIVEDNQVNQLVLNRQLKRHSFDTLTADNGEVALSILHRSTWWHDPVPDPVHISIILCDLEMPVMDGWTFVRRVRECQDKGELESEIKMVAVTGNARSEQVRAARDAGFDDIVCKPYSIATLVPLIHEMISGGSDEDGDGDGDGDGDEGGEGKRES